MPDSPLFLALLERLSNAFDGIKAPTPRTICKYTAAVVVLRSLGSSMPRSPGNRLCWASLAI